MPPPPFPSLVRGRWLIATLAVLALCALFLRLATWQFQRLADRRAANAQILARMEQQPLALDGAALDVEAVVLRRATARGVYDYDQELLLRNRSYNELPGIHVIVPLRIAGSDAAVLVDRGWLPYEVSSPEQRGEYQERPAGEVTVTGILRGSMVRASRFSPEDPPLGPDRPRLDAWHRIDIPRIQEQTPYPLLSLYLEETPESAADQRRFPRPVPEITLSEGRHLVYAIQWIAFAIILAGGYAGYYRSRIAKK